MRRLRSDVSHRMRTRMPSLLGAIWFRLLLIGGAVVLIGVVMGPALAAWLGAEVPAPIRFLAPWTPAPPPQGVVVARSPGPAAGRTPAPPGPESSSRVPVPSAAPVPAPPSPAGTVASPRPVAEPDPTAGRRSAPPARAVPSSVPVPGVFRIQVGAFLDAANADRLVERLRREGFEAVQSGFEQSRVLYRVFLVAADEAETERVAAEAEPLAINPERTDAGLALTGFQPLGEAVENSRRLRERGLQVRVQQTVGSATYRIVRVGAYESGREAEAARARLIAQGFEGYVVRER